MIIINGMELDRLCRGTTLLTVPLVDGAVQVGIGGDFPTTTLAVSVSASSVRVRRLDGRSLQVHIVEDWRDAAEPGVATQVFDEPVEELLLERRGGTWIPASATRGHGVALERFVGTLTRFALAKQRRAVVQDVGAA
ncbi:hypothetical protein BN970_00267 [Mycolicibacterium conceptionense]|jgi:hypothetical protein|uniref:Uncharacterized protein n=4 Tax=Mycolicibacterium TaxID=1866885 RepID=A0A0U1CXK2_9MYCO|nr:hypothetical protein BN970_00267 [Mycolicibacterium conceptionense]